MRDVLSSVGTVAMNDGVVPVVFGTTATDGFVVAVAVGRHPCFSTQDLKPRGCRTMAVGPVLGFTAEVLRQRWRKRGTSRKS